MTFFNHTRRDVSKEPQPQMKQPDFQRQLVEQHKKNKIKENKADQGLMIEIAFGRNKEFVADEYRQLATQFIDDKNIPILISLFKEVNHPIIQENVVYKIYDKQTLTDLASLTKNARVLDKIHGKIQESQGRDALLEVLLSSTDYTKKVFALNSLRGKDLLDNYVVIVLINEFDKELKKSAPSMWYSAAILEALLDSRTSDEYKYEKFNELATAVSEMQEEGIKHRLQSTISVMRNTHVCLQKENYTFTEEPLEE